jgi:hypothetical protein
MTRKKIPQSTETEIFVLSRRRCCVCYVLNNDETEKRGQIAHLDGDHANPEINNLAFLCFDHHDQLDSQTSQSKGLTAHEVKRYRQILYDHFATWSKIVSREHLLNFLAYRISDLDIAMAVVEVASRVYFYGPRHACDVLTQSQVQANRYGEIIEGHLFVLGYCAAWGLLTYETEEIEHERAGPLTLITVHHLPICKRLVEMIEELIKEKGELNWDSAAR